jgi:hypothetical protein
MRLKHSKTREESVAEEWVLFFRDSAGRDVRVASTSKQAALIEARGLLRLDYGVHKI